MAYIGKTPVVGNFQVCDAISVVNGQAAYTLQVGGANVSPESANHMLVSLNGILQKPGSSFTISGSTMTFASNLATGDVIDFVQILGNVLDIGQPSDDTVTAAKLNNDIISGSTELAAIPAGTDELLISDAGTLKRIDASFFQNTPAFYAYLSSNQSVTNGANTKVQINTEIFDSDNAFDNSSNYRFTPQTAGKYMVYVSLCGATDGYRIYQITPKVYKNGSSYATTSEVIQDDVFNRFTINLETVVDMNGSSDYLEFYGFVDIHANNNELFIGGSSKSTYFGAYKLIT